MPTVCYPFCTCGPSIRVKTPRPPPCSLRDCCQCVCLACRYLPHQWAVKVQLRGSGGGRPLLLLPLRRTRRSHPLQLISQRGGGATGKAGMRGALLLGAASCLEGAMAQDTGGPFKGSEAISKQTPGHCVDNRGMTIPEGMLFEPGPDQCQVRPRDIFKFYFAQNVNCQGVHVSPAATCALPHGPLRSSTRMFVRQSRRRLLSVVLRQVGERRQPSERPRFETRRLRSHRHPLPRSPLLPHLPAASEETAQPAEPS